MAYREFSYKGNNLNDKIFDYLIEFIDLHGKEKTLYIDYGSGMFVIELAKSILMLKLLKWIIEMVYSTIIM